MFEHLGVFDKIIVTGPQRSGTRICARMIAADTGHTYVDKDEYGVHDVASFAEILERSQIVVHAPAMSRFVHYFDGEDTLIVWMRRDLNDILSSQARVNWTAREEWRERVKYNGMRNKQPIAAIKIDFWERVQRPVVENYLEVEYDSLSAHPLWIPEEQRRGWHAKQWRDES